MSIIGQSQLWFQYDHHSAQDYPYGVSVFEKMNSSGHLSMSRRTKFVLQLPSGGLKAKIAIAKATSEKTGFTRTYVDEDTGKITKVRRVDIVPKEDGIKPENPDDIEKIIPWGSGTSCFPYTDEEGEKQLLTIDKEVLGKLYKSGDVMKVVSFLPATEISPCQYDGYHYFVSPQYDRKTKEVERNDQQAYSLLLYTMKLKDQVMLVKFVSADREKNAVIYPHGDIMMMSILFHSNYQREAPKVQSIDLPKAQALADKLIAKFGAERYNPEITEDQVEARLKEYIEQRKEEERLKKSGVKPKKKLTLKPVKTQSLEDDFLSQLESI